MTNSRPFVRGGIVLNRLVNPIARRFGGVTVLTVAGRTSGEPRPVPLGKPLDYHGRRYLVSGRGETHWVRNLRAAKSAELRIGGRTERFRPVEITGPEQAEIVAAYREALGHSVDRYFAEIPDPADHPVFLIEAAEDAAER